MSLVQYIDRKDEIHDNILLSDFRIKFLFYQAVRASIPVKPMLYVSSTMYPET